MNRLTRLFNRKPEAVMAELPPFGMMRLDERVSAWIGEAEWLGARVLLMIELDFDRADPEPALPAARRLFEEAADWDAAARAAILRDLPQEVAYRHAPGDADWAPHAMLGWLRLIAISASRDFHQLEYDASGRLGDDSVVVTIDWARGEVRAEVQG